MLERIREGSQGPWAMGILALVILSFIFAGVGSYINSSAASAAATVNGEEIGLDDLERAYQNERNRVDDFNFGGRSNAGAWCDQYRLLLLPTDNITY